MPPPLLDGSAAGDVERPVAGVADRWDARSSVQTWSPSDGVRCSVEAEVSNRYRVALIEVTAPRR